MPRRTDAAPPDLSADRGGAPGAGSPGAGQRAEQNGAADLSALPVAGLTRHRVLILTIVLAVGWLAFAFIRQVGDVTAASGRADALAAANKDLSADIAALDGELRLIQRQEYIVQQARAYRVGSAREVPFSLQKPLPSLGPDAPGSAGERLGAPSDRPSPLESWLTLLFGSAT